MLTYLCIYVRLTLYLHLILFLLACYSEEILGKTKWKSIYFICYICIYMYLCVNIYNILICINKAKKPQALFPPLNVRKYVSHFFLSLSIT